MKTLAQIQAELAAQSQTQARQDANARAAIPSQGAFQSQAIMNSTGIPRYGNTLAWDASQAQDSAINAANTQAGNNQAAIAGQDPTRSPGAAMDRILGMGDQAYQNAYNNPVDQMLMQELSSRVKGQNLPYDQRTVNAMQTGSANQAAAAERANNNDVMARMEAQGFSPKDPAYMAALSANQLQRQQANQASNLSINQNANVANYAAQGQAINQANAVNRGGQAQQLAATQLATQGLNQVSAADSGRAPSWQQLPTWQNYTQKKTMGPKPATQAF